MGCFDFEPRGGALAGLIDPVLALGDDAFEAPLECRGIQRFCILRRVHELDASGGQEALSEIAAPINVRRTPQIEAGKMQKVEAHEHDWRALLRNGDFLRRLQLRAVLQRVERRAAIRRQRHDLAIQDHRVDGLPGQVRHDFRKES